MSRVDLIAHLEVLIAALWVLGTLGAGALILHLVRVAQRWTR